MKPVKGMNLDVTPGSQPDGTYRRAQNWIYGQTLDGLFQEPGTRLVETIANKHLIAGYAFDDDTFVLFALDNTATVDTGSVIYKYELSSDTLTTVISDDDLAFTRDSVFDLATYVNHEGQKVVIFTDNVNPVRVVNIDQPNTNLATNKLYPDFDIPSITANSTIAGQLAKGTHFFCARYVSAEGEFTPFVNLIGPLRLDENGYGYVLTFTNVDTDYQYLEVGILSVVDNSISARVVHRQPINNSTVHTISVTGAVTVQELTIEDIIVGVQPYVKAKTIELHDGRLYMANLESHAEDDLQAQANKIQPLYELVGTDHDTARNDYAEDQYFMFDEVYAFYVAWVRADGSMTKAYHIPGQPAPVTYTHDHGDGTTSSITLSDDLTTLQSTHSFLSTDKDISATGYYWQTRCTANIDIAKTRGSMGYWENADETYPSDFPAGIKYTWDATFSTSSSASETLAGQPVRHHRMPSRKWLLDKGVNFTALSAIGLQARFTNVPAPDGYVGAKFFYASRRSNNSIVMAQDYSILGSPNYYSQFGNGGSDFDEYYSNSVTNLPLRNVSIGEEVGFDNAPQTWRDYWFTDNTVPARATYYHEYVRPEMVTMRPFDMLEDKPALGSGTLYIKNEYIHVVKESYNGLDYTVEPKEYSLHHNMAIDTDPNAPNVLGEYYYALTPDTYGRNKVMFFNGRSNSTNANTDDSHYAGAPTRHIKISHESEVCRVVTARYCAADAINEDLEFDNRFGDECLGLALSENVAAYKTGMRDSFNRFQRNINSNGERGLDEGYWLDTTGVAALGNPQVYYDVHVPMVCSNVCRYRENVYEGYAQQDLVACTPVVSGSLVQKAMGDCVYSYQNTRVTAGVGWNGHAHNYSPNDDPSTFGTPTIQELDNSAGTIDHSRGNVKAYYRMPRLCGVNYEHLENEQHDRGVYRRLTESTTAERSHEVRVDGHYKTENNFIQPDIADPDDTYIYKFPYRVVRSEKQQPDDRGAAIKNFAPLDLFEQPKTRGVITNLHSYTDKLIIHHERAMYITLGQEKIGTTAGDIVIGTGDIFRVPPKEVTPSEYGYAGLEYPMSATMTPMGYFFVDTVQRKVFLYNGKLNDISRTGMRSFFQEFLLLDGWNDGSTVVDNGAVHSFYPGLVAEYDPRYNRVVLLIRNHKNLISDGSGSVLTSPVPLNNTSYLSSPKIEVTDECLSFSLDNMAWTSFHSYRADYMLATNNALYSVVSDGSVKLYEHGDLTQPSNDYLGKSRVAAFIDIAIPAGANAQYQSFRWDTRALDSTLEVYYDPAYAGAPDVTSGYTDHTKTFGQAVVYTDTQCSGEVTLTVPAVSDGELQASNLRRVDGYWNFNGFRDIVSDRTARFMDRRGNLVTSNLDSNLEWYDQRRFTGNYAVLRLLTTTDDSDTNALYLLSVEAKARKLTR